ncbi:uncharacterized protein LOC123553963 [Mercenaria mercenaria]|uniref:uncharacterized protein LOC123553963 n=1 Tax=Mercenaria mercenaria TaxID=6596 RepID=UPI00234EE999|nr:uncharacterized protein LOC123553963 [Mercenaria mercenaria]XP_045199703.2 uncharacterized protein LOC123553963 [Mercenaria mercenaria]
MKIRLRPNHHPMVLLRAAKIRMKNHSKLVTVISILLGIFLLIYGRTVFHVTGEFLTHSNFNFNLCKRFHQMTHVETKQSAIPKIIHQVFLNVSTNRMEFFKKYEPYRRSWQEKNPGFKYILWNASMIETLINKSYPSIGPLYKRYRNIWQARADIARYLVVHYMGGIYADIDITCRGSMEELYNEIGDKRVALNYTYNPFGIANDFFVASRNHEFMAHVLDGLQAADVLYFTPFLNSMFRTGPMYMLGRYLNYPHQEDVYFLQSSRLYISSENSDKSWHGIDGYVIAIIWNGVDSLQILSVILLIVFIVRLNKLLKIRAKLVKKSRKRVQFYDGSSMLPIMEEDAL